MSGVLASFGTEHALRNALARLQTENVGKTETYTPFALDPEDKRSILPLLMFLAGMAGFVFFLWLMSFADVWDYPLDIGGRPPFAWPAFTPITFELSVLCAMGAGFAGWFIAGRMPRLYEPVDECEGIREASRSRWLVAVHETDPRRLAHARSVLEAMHPERIEDIP